MNVFVLRRTFGVSPQLGGSAAQKSQRILAEEVVMSERVYLDWNATAPLRFEARDAMIAATDVVGNPSSVHAEGRLAKSLIERARGQVLDAFGASGADLIFTSGATEAATLALASQQNFCSRNYPSPVEHDCVYAHYQCGLSDTGPQLITDWTFRENGSLEASFGDGIWERAIAGGNILSVTAANSETGVMNATNAFSPTEMGRGDHQLFVDAVQAFGKVPFAFNWSGADMAILSAHKIGGPKGIGALIVKRGTDIEAVLKGGGQEMGRRSGTENVVGIAGFGAAAEAAARDLADGAWDRVAELRKILENALEAEAPGTILIGRDAPRLPNTSCFATPGWKGETQVMAMDLAGFAISAGSACSSGKVRASRVLKAMGYDDVTAASAIRVSMGPTTTEDEVLRFIDAWTRQEKKFRQRAA